MTQARFQRPALRRTAAAAIGVLSLALTGCTTLSLPGGADLINDNPDGLPRQPTAQRPEPDARGVITYPTYQVAVAQGGDTVQTIAQRLGLDAQALATTNGLPVDATLSAGELVLLNARVEPVGGTQSLSPGGEVDVATLAGTALDRADGTAPATGTQTITPAQTQTAAAQPRSQAGVEPVRHVVKRGETAYSIARAYDVTVASLAEWNGLDRSMSVREGQTLLIPVATGPAPAVPSVTAPGSGTPTPEPPSAAKPLPPQDLPPAAAAAAKPAATSPVTAPQTKASDTARLAQPVAGRIIHPYKPGTNEGVDFGAPTGTPVKAAAAGTVAAITRDTDQVTIIVIRHSNNLLTVYANVGDVQVEKGTTVSRGQTLGTVGGGNPSFLHFEVREGFESVDPVDYLSG
ncbi:MAG: LysM peptidoglycan-binding domain-containing M23 family metallopeptidase [Rhodobacteraceae bacterium]|nr:LysM peptidoglycan-binding domain-containing M23 family metallopeptidase [Paracoccaceae bacterium]